MGKMISGSQMKSYCVERGLYAWFKSKTNGPFQAAYDEMQGGELNFQNDHPSNINGLMTAIINSTSENEKFADYAPEYIEEKQQVEIVFRERNIKPLLISLHEKCLEYANPSPVISEFIQEELTLPDSTERKIYTLTFTENPVGIANVEILQRYGTEEDLTEWHPASNFSNVKYKQNSYKTVVNECDHEVRQLKVVSNQTIGMSVI